METTSVAWTQQATSAQKPSGYGNVRLLALATVAISTLSFAYFYLRGEVLLYGDAVAHMNIARRVFDSRTPGFSQLGTVWLPLPHILTIPFIRNQWLWQSGVGGSIVSMIAYLFAGLGIARLFWKRLLNEEQPTGQGAGGWIAALVLLLNPNLIYMQATAMTESLSLALTIWVIVWFAEFLAAGKKAAVLNASDEDHKRALQRTRRSLIFCAMTLAAAMFTRYDAWFLGVAVGIAVLASWFFLYPWLRGKLSVALLVFVMLTAAVPLFWFAYNFRIYKNPLEFANGPYSARGIEKRTARPGSLPHPGFHDIKTAVIYYWKDARLNLGEGKLLQPAVVLLAIGGVLILVNGKHFWILLFLWLPLFFYSLSIAYGGVPIFMPVWNPFAYYNVRYGLQLLPAIAMALGAVGSLINHRITRRYLRYTANSALVLVVLACYGQAWRSVPICLREARVNAVTRMDFENKLATELSKLPPQTSLLMYTGSHVGALQQAGIPLRRTVNEGNYGIWQAALADPGQVDYVIAQRDDAVWQSAQQHASQLEPVADIAVPGQPEAIIYRVKAIR
jgi:hypothetical protein